MPLYTIDLLEFAKTGQTAQGKFSAYQDLPRVLAEMPSIYQQPLPENSVGIFEWQIQGLQQERMPSGLKDPGYARRYTKYSLALQGHGHIGLICQRCLQPYVQALEFENLFEILRKEPKTQKEFDEDEADWLLTSEQFDLKTLIEEEILLALPIIPKHDQCISLEMEESTDFSAKNSQKSPVGTQLLKEASSELIDAGTPQKISPFSVLSALKKK